MHRSKYLVLLLPAVSLLAFACDSGTSTDTPPGGTGGLGGADGLGGAPGTDGALWIDDFEDGNLDNQLGVTWHFYGDTDAAGASVTSAPADAPGFVANAGHESNHALSLDYALDRGAYAWDPFVGVGTTVPASAQPASYEGISYFYKGAAHTVRFETSNIADYDFYNFPLPAAASWTKVTIPFASLTQAGYGAPAEWDPALLQTINWHIVGGNGTTGSFSLDDVRFEASAPVDRGPKNLVVRPAEPPEKTDLGDVTIDTPLQRKALAQLDRGYNLTNWLESARFQSFEFDEAYIEKLAAAGFKSLRLPIDLDLYVTASSGSGDAVEVTVHDDLWTILDNFEAWTEEHGLSYTIDYHQYDRSFTFSDTEGVDLAVALWKTVAAHFADNPRDDIYFELLNEPELTTGAATVLPASSWTPVAERMIDAIRSEDATHTIIFGDVNWYGIDQLAAREPFDDTNIVYAFHSYEPFIFTHQGADWSQMSTTHDLPFPYTPERWSEYASDLGLTSTQPAWIWDQFRNYYIHGTPEAVYNRIATAKAWALEHQVPIICNEFGTYDRKSRLEDRVNYYNALIGAFEELQIPWQVWFMIMDDDGNVLPEYVDAFNLDG